MTAINITRITAAKANELLQEGGLNWFLFSGDDFDKELFEEWAEVELDAAHVAEIESRLADLTGDEVLSVTAV